MPVSPRDEWVGCAAPILPVCFASCKATLPAAATEELHAALLQAALTAALALLCAFLFQRYRKPYFGWWAGAWRLYVLRIVAITSFLLTADWIWLYWHQVVTGWTALALLYAALVFSQAVRWRPWYLALVLFPPVWSYIAIYRLDQFLWAAGPAVLFLSLATLGPAGRSSGIAGGSPRAGPRCWRSRSGSGDCTISTIPSCAPGAPGRRGDTTSTSCSRWPSAPASCCWCWTISAGD